MSSKFSSECNLDQILGIRHDDYEDEDTKTEERKYAPIVFSEVEIDKSVRMQVFKKETDMTATDEFKITRHKQIGSGA